MPPPPHYKWQGHKNILTLLNTILKLSIPHTYSYSNLLLHINQDILFLKRLQLQISRIFNEADITLHGFTLRPFVNIGKKLFMANVILFVGPTKVCIYGIELLLVNEWNL